MNNENPSIRLKGVRMDGFTSFRPDFLWSLNIVCRVLNSYWSSPYKIHYK